MPGFLAVLLLAGRPLVALAADTPPAPSAQQAFEASKKEYEAHPLDSQAAWHFARAAFDLADLASGNSERATIAQEGIKACKQALTEHSNSAPLHYYLGLNEAELARTRSLGALKLVDQMEIEFTRTIELDPLFDYAGAERSLALLYRDAPVLMSIGSRAKARAHLQKALELAPRYPENRLNLIESEIKWGDRKSAHRELKLLEDAWPGARAEFAGPEWSGSWNDWTARLEKVRKTLEEPPRLETPRH